MVFYDGLPCGGSLDVFSFLWWFYDLVGGGS